MSHQLCFWYKQLNLQVPSKVCPNGGVFLWKDGREVPDTVDALMVHGEDLMFTWDSAFGNDELSKSEDVLGTDGTIFLYRSGRMLRWDPIKEEIVA